MRYFEEILLAFQTVEYLVVWKHFPPAWYLDTMYVIVLNSSQKHNGPIRFWFNLKRPVETLYSKHISSVRSDLTEKLSEVYRQTTGTENINRYLKHCMSMTRGVVVAGEWIVCALPPSDQTFASLT